MKESKMNVVAMVPARMGSERLAIKNLALLNGHPLISYAIEAAKSSGIFSRIVVNSDGDVFESVALRQGVEFYLRPSELGSSETKSDEVVYDFMQKHPSDAVAWVNPTSPLQTGDEVRNVVNHFFEQELDSMITVKTEQVHCIYEGNPLNFTVEGLFARTQDLTPVHPFAYSVMMWRTQPFMEAYEREGHALLSGKFGYVPVSKESSVLIKTDVDLMIAESILKATAGQQGYQVTYDALAKVSD